MRVRRCRQRPRPGRVGHQLAERPPSRPGKPEQSAERGPLPASGASRGLPATASPASSAAGSGSARNASRQWISATRPITGIPTIHADGGPASACATTRVRRSGSLQAAAAAHHGEQGRDPCPRRHLRECGARRSVPPRRDRAERRARYEGREGPGRDPEERSRRRERDHDGERRCDDAGCPASAIDTWKPFATSLRSARGRRAAWLANSARRSGSDGDAKASRARARAASSHRNGSTAIAPTLVDESGAPHADGASLGSGEPTVLMLSRRYSWPTGHLAVGSLERSGPALALPSSDTRVIRPTTAPVQRRSQSPDLGPDASMPPPPGDDHGRSITCGIGVHVAPAMDLPGPLRSGPSYGRIRPSDLAVAAPDREDHRLVARSPCRWGHPSSRSARACPLPCGEGDEGAPLLPSVTPRAPG